MKKKDKHVESVVKKMKKRSKQGIKKYGTTLERKDYTIIDWLSESQQEAMDLSLYLEALISKMKKLKLD